MTSISLGYIGLSVTDVDAWRRYLSAFTGAMEGARAASGATRFRLDDHAWRISVEQGELDDLGYMGLEVQDAPALDMLRNRLAAAGVAFTEGTEAQRGERGVMGLILTQDPSGIPLEIYYGPTILSNEPFASPTGTRFVTGDQGLGHLALASDKGAECHAFYVGALGFRQADTIRMRMTDDFALDLEFFYGNPRHHTLALAPLPFPPPKRIHHLMFQVEEFDQVGYALDRTRQCDVQLTRTIGRHSNDKMISFYCSTPSGFELEYGFGAIEIHGSDWTVARHDRISAWGHHLV